jgi:solute carrier family 12 (sodium/potassium/chloride transporter), member 2
MNSTERFNVTQINEPKMKKQESFRNEIVLNIGDYAKKVAQSPAMATPAAAASPDGKDRKISTGPLEDELRRLSFSQSTREALPRLDNYRVSKRALKRPSMGELHGDPDKTGKDVHDGDDSPSHTPHIQLGWITGVLIPCLLNIWGVMLFLRLAWVVAQAGILQTLIIIGISYGVCLITTLSLSAICTNGDVKGGGIYYIISRSLGPEFGASVGLVFAFANTVAASMNTIGFCDSLNGLLSK